LACVRSYVLLKADYSQMEMRILAHVSADEFLMQFFHEGRDIHKLIAARWLGTLHWCKRTRALPLLLM